MNISPIEQLHNNLMQCKQTIDTLMLRMMQTEQLINQYRTSIYTIELRTNLIIKMLEEKSLIARGEFEKRWPIYLQKDVGISVDGKMEGTLKVTFYGN